MTRQFFASTTFLEKVERGAVKWVRGYSMRRGGYDRYYGGEATYRAHAQIGCVKWDRAADIGRPATAVLTPLGRKVLATRRAEKSKAQEARGTTK